ncbi:hypothetical protein DERF_014969 [Dermatophagoides farinae]|uniref:Uncharacterized protein n=1 Tax=Dermatophagoides farinae TaxID=6954 RepID=A0A922HKN6_DERFA|nr:hypothetical protein DERF_014969 [Dermatophagoides farinae]
MLEPKIHFPPNLFAKIPAEVDCPPGHVSADTGDIVEKFVKRSSLCLFLIIATIDIFTTTLNAYTRKKPKNPKITNITRAAIKRCIKRPL